MSSPASPSAPRPGLAADERGVSTVFTALSLAAMLGFLALGLNAAAGLARKRDLQQAADAAAEAGAAALRGGMAAAPVARGLAHARLGADAEVSVEWPPARGRRRGDARAIAVEVAAPRTAILGGLLDAEAGTVRARAVSAVIEDGPACLLALDQGVGAIAETGGGRLLLSGCRALADGPGVPAARLPQANPYSIPGTPPPACLPGQLAVTGTLVVRPGQLPQARCGGIRVASGGTLRIEGLAWPLAGPLTVEPGGRLETAAATLWSGPFALDIRPGATVSLQPPATGAFAGVAVLGAASGPRATSRFLAGAAQTLTGAILLPTQAVEISGNAASCTQVVAARIRVSGITPLAHACDGTGVRPIVDRRVALVE